MFKHLYLILLLLLVTACATQPQMQSRMFPEKEWRHEDSHDPQYLLAPGDRLEIIVHNVPELSRTVTIGPDGRVRAPYSGPIRASARTVEDVRADLIYAMRHELRDPQIDVLLTETTSQRVFVGGAVAQPGMVELPGLIDPLQAVIMAGGVTTEGRAQQVVLMRRMPGGEVKTAVIDLEAGIYDARYANWTPLRRFDVVYVTRKPIADQNLFVQQYIRNALPIDFSLFYDIAGQRN